MNFFACNWDLILHPLNFWPLSSMRLNLATAVEEVLISACLTCTELHAKALSTQWGSSKGYSMAATSLYKCICLQFKNLNIQNYIPELNLDLWISLISHTLVLGWHVARWASSTPVQERWCGSPWVDVAMLNAFICLAVGVILMASGLFLSKAISKSERSCLKAFTSHELCILFCILPFLSLTCSFRSCNVLLSTHIKSESLVPRAGAQESLFILYFPTYNFFAWLASWFFFRWCLRKKMLVADNNIFRLFSAFPSESPESNTNLLGIQQQQLLPACHH